MVRSVLVARAMRRVGIGSGLALAIAGALLACASGRLPAPIYIGQTTEALQPVTYPPPPARAETVPDAPAHAVWIDGEWQWQGERWAWKQGRWVVPPPGARFSPWTATRDELGTLYVAEGRWRAADGGELPEPAPAAVARTRAGPVVNAEGDAVESAPNIKPAAADAAGPLLRDDGGPPETPSGATPSGTEPKRKPLLPDGGLFGWDAGLTDASSSPRMAVP